MSNVKSFEDMFRIKAFDVIYADKEELYERLKKAKSTEEFWTLCGAISELNSLIEYLTRL